MLHFKFKFQFRSSQTSNDTVSSSHVINAIYFSTVLGLKRSLFHAPFLGSSIGLPEVQVQFRQIQRTSKNKRQLKILYYNYEYL